MAIKPGIMNIGGGNTAPSSDETKKREEGKISEEEREAARRIVEGYYRNTVSSDNRGFTQDYANAVERAGTYGAGWTNENAPTDDISRAQENASGLARNTELYSGAVDKAFGSGVSGSLYDTYTDASKNLSDIRTGVRAQRDLYSQYENADDYNADQRLFSMSSEELKKESDKIRQTLDETKKNAYKGILGFGYIKDADGRYRLYTPDSPMAVPDSIKSMEDQLLKLDALYNSKKYSEDVSKYGIDPASMTYDQLMDTMRVGSDDEKRFALDYYNSLGQSNLQTKRAVEWYASLPKDEKAKIDSMWNSAVARGMTSNGVSLYAAQDILRDDLVKNGYTKNEAETMADLYVRHLNEGMNRNVQRVAEQYGSEHPLSYPLLMSAEKALTGYAELLAPALYKIRENITGRPVDVNEPLMVQNRKYETAQTAAQNSDMWKGVQNTASRLFGEESGEQVTRVLSSALYSGMDDAARFLGGLGLGAAGATASAVSSVTALLASGGAGLTEFRHNIEEGKSTNEALARGILSAAIEFGTEAVGGEFVWNNILGEGAEGFFKSLAKAALAEGTEEVMGNVASRTLSGIADPDTWNKVGKAFHGGSWGEAGQALINNSEWVKDVKAYTDQGLSLDSAMTRALGDWVSEDAEAFLSAFLSAGLSSGLTKTIRRAETNFSKKVIGDMVNSLTHDGLLKMVRNVEAKLKSGASDGKPYTKEAAADDVERVRGALVNARENVVQSMTGEESTEEDRAFAEKEAEKINRAIGQVEELSSAIRNDRTAEIPQIASSIEASIREETEREAEEARTKSKRERAISDFVRGLVYGGTRMAQIDQDLSAEIRRLDADAKNGVEGAQKKLDFANEALAYLRRNAVEEVSRDGLNAIGKSLDLLGHGKDRLLTIQYDFAWNDDQRNASYDRATNTVTLNPYSPMTQNHVRFVLGHELLHALRADGERGQAIVDSAWNTIQSLMESGQIRRDDENYNMDVLSKLYAGDVRSYLNGEEGRAEVASYVKQGMTEEAARAKAAEQYLKEEAVANFFGDASFWGLDKNGNPIDRRTLMWSENDTERQRREKAKQLKNLSPLFDVNAVLSDLTQSKARRVLSDFVRTIRNFARSIVGAKPVEAKRFDTLADAYEAVLKRFDAKPVNNTANTENASEAAQGAATEAGDAIGDEAAGTVRNSRSEKSDTAEEQSGRIAEPSIEAPDGEVLMDELRGGTQARSSRTSWNNTDKEAVLRGLTDAGFSKERADRYIENVNSIAAIIGGDADRLDYDAASNQVFMKPNTEYVITLDASTLCAKRLVYQGTFDKIAHRLKNRVLMPTDLIALSNMMNENGYVTPCGICYVESRRRWLSKFASEWLDEYEGEYKPTLDEVVSTDGLERLRIEHPDTYNDFVKAMNSKGSANPKVVQLRTDYRGDINRLTKGQIEKILRIGGVRIQSFSDFETPHLIDIMQAVIDLSARKLTAQAYTKVPNFAWVFGGTGIKINLSLMGDVDENGNLVFDDKEGMPFEEAMKLRDEYSENVGTILVGRSDAHILAAMADPRIDFIIPFHKSGWSEAELKAMKTLDGYSDYTEYQSERRIVGRTKNGKYKTESIKEGNLYPIDYWDYSLSGKENAEKYLRICAEERRLPKFYNFLVDNGDGSFSLQPDGSTDGYWKTLIDFKMYDNDGNGAPQRAVTPDFNMKEANRVLKDYEGGANELPSASDEFIDKFIDWYENEHGGERSSRSVTPEENARYMELAKDPVKNADELQRMVDEAARKAGAMTLPNGKRKPYYHGTAEKFTVFDINKSLYGIQGYGFYFTPMKHFAEGYGDASAYYLMTDRIATREDHNITPEQVVEIRRAYGLPLGEDALGKAQGWIEKSNDMDIIKSLESEITRNTDAKPEEFLQRFREVFGYDGLRHAYETVLWDNTLIKSADSVTYDDSGNVIPLSERFNTEDEDIRHSRSISPDYASLDVEEINANEITPLNDITDRGKYDRIAKDLSEHGWDGRPIVAVKNANNGYIALTGSHRVLAAQKARVPVKAVVIDDNEDIRALLDASDDEERAAIADSLAESGVIDRNVASLIVRENDLNYENYNVPYEEQARFSRSLTQEQRKLMEAERRVERLKEDNEFLRRLMESGRKAALSPRSVERIVREVSDLYGLGRDERIRTALGIVDKLYNGKVTGQEIEDAIRQLSALSRDMIRDAFYEEDPTREDRERLRAYLKDKTIRVTPELEGELKGRGEKWGDARNAMRKYLNLARNGTTSIDSIWEEMHDLFPGYFPMDVYNPADMIERVVEVLDGMEPQAVSVYPEEAVEQNAESLYNALVGKYAKYGDKAFGERLAEGDEAATQRAEARADAEIASAKQSYFRDMGQQELKYLARIRRIEADAARDAKEYSDRIADLESQARAKAMRGSATEMLDAARKNARYIWSAAKNPTGKRFVPQNARGAMERLSNWIDSITVRGGVLNVDGKQPVGAALPSDPVRGDIAVIAKVYGAEYAELADALLNTIDYYARYQSGADYQRERNAVKSAWIAKTTYKLSQLLRHAVANQNRVWLDGKRRDAETVGGDMIDALNERRGADERFTSVKDKTFGEKAKEGASKLLRFWKTDPGLAVTDAYTFLHRIGGRGDEVFDTLRHAQETQTLRNQEFVESMQTKLKGIDLSKYGDEKWDKYTVTFADARGREVTVPRSVAMSVAALWRRMQGREHLENGGFVYDLDGKRSDPIRVGEKSVKSIEDALTEDDKKVMGAMLSFMQDDCTRWGNEATMRRYGFERFTTDNYFRIDVDRFALPANTDKSFSGQPKIENTSFAKPTREGAGAPVVAGDFIRSVIHHVNGMATYSAYLNAEGMVNQILSTKGLRDTMQRVLGNGSVKYVEDLMTALKSQTRNEEDALEKLWSMGAAYYKTAAVAYNLSTALKQPISYTRAAAVMDTKYLTRGMKAVTSSEGRNRALGEMQEFSGTAVKKLNGYSDTGMARDTAMLIGAKKETVRQKIVEFGMRSAEFGDRITWEALWTACREETRDRNPDLTQPELMEATAKRFSSVVAQTQVTNSPLDTAPILRSNSVLTRNLFAFWNEPLKTYNLLMRAYDNIVQAKDGAAAKRALFAAARPVASVAAGMVLEAAVSALFRSLRDDRDDDMDDPETWKKLISLWGGEMVDNAFGVLPYVDQFREVIRNAMNGYSNTDMGLEVITDILDAAKALADSDGEKAKTTFSRIRALAEAVATAFGIPAKNVLRTVKTIGSTALNFGGNIKAQYNYRKIFYNPKNATAREKYGFADLLAKAYIEGDEEAYRYIRDDMLQMGLSPASITKSIVKNAAPDDVDGSSSSLTAYKPGSDGWYLAMGAVYDRATGAPRGLEEEVTRLYEATGDSGVLPGFAPDSFTVNGKEVKIDGEAYTEFSESYAKRLYEVQTAIRNTAGYRAATDEQKAWWLEKGETVIGAILKHGIDADYNVTSQGKWIADYLNATDAAIGKYIVENTKKSGADSQQTRTRGAEVVNTPKSTEFSQIGYDPSTGTLAVTFRDSGATYTYGGVPESEWNAMQSADSIGKYYNANIKGKYKSEKAG